LGTRELFVASQAVGGVEMQYDSETERVGMSSGDFDVNFDFEDSEVSCE